MLKILVLDLETTGLEPVTNKILEIGWLKVIMERSSLSVVSTGSSVIYYDLSQIEPIMNESVKKMHTSSGLLDDIKSSNLSLSSAEDILVGHTACKGWILTGNSIAFDRSFIKIHMPQLEKNLHYRMIDTSNYALLKKELGIPVNGMKLSAHRAMNDCLNSLSLLQMTISELE